MSTRREFLKDIVCAAAGTFVAGTDIETLVASPQQSAPKEIRREVMVGGRRTLTVDIHNHWIIDIRDLVKDNQDALNDPSLNPERGGQLFSSVEARLRHMNETGIDMQAVSFLQAAFCYWADRNLAARIVERQNTKLMKLCTLYPDRFVGLGAVSIQHPDLAVEQMEYGAKKQGLRGFQIGGSVNGEDLSAPKFYPFWAKAEELGTLIFIHPFRPLPEIDRRFKGNGYLDNVIGNPAETTVALAHLIFDGILDRYPGLKICGAHGGGYMASYLGRADHCAEASANCKPVRKLPSEYFKQQLYCDSIVFSSENLRHLVASVGASHVLLGTDFPANITEPHMGEPRAVDFVLGTAGLSEADQIAILGGNAAKLLGIVHSTI